MMGRTLDDVMAALPAAQRAEIEARTKVLLAEVETYKAVRRVAAKARVAAARALKLPAGASHRLPREADAYLSALSHRVEALGGRLELVVHFPERAPVRIERLGDLTGAEEAPSRPVKRRAAKAKGVPAAA
jgi:hypothetical protein